MKRKIISIVLTLALVVSSLVIGTSAMAADGYENSAAITAGADRLVETQNADGGWDWGDMAGTTSISDAASPKNTVGVTALGLLSGYHVNSNQAYLDAAELAAAYITANHLAANRMRAPDMTFLVELSDITGNAAYLTTAQDGWSAILATHTTATSFGNYIVAARNSQIAIWDLNLYVVGLMAIGETADAIELAAVTETAVGTYLDETKDYYSLALSGAIETYALTGVNTGAIGGLSAALIGLGNTDVQSTAYAVMALLRINADVSSGISYLLSTQDGSGGFIETDGSEYTEPDSEAVQALYAYAVAVKAAQEAQEQAEYQAEQTAEQAYKVQWRATHHSFTMSQGGTSKGKMSSDGTVTEAITIVGTYNNNQYKLEIDSGCTISSRNLYFLTITDTYLVSSFGACKFTKPVTVSKFVNGEWVVLGTFTEIVEDPGEGARMITGTATFN